MQEPIDILRDAALALEKRLKSMDVFEAARQTKELEKRLGKPLDEATWGEVMEACNEHYH